MSAKRIKRKKRRGEVRIDVPEMFQFEDAADIIAGIEAQGVNAERFPSTEAEAAFVAIVEDIDRQSSRTSKARAQAMLDESPRNELAEAIAELARRNLVNLGVCSNGTTLFMHLTEVLPRKI